MNNTKQATPHSSLQRYADQVTSGRRPAPVRRQGRSSPHGQGPCFPKCQSSDVASGLSAGIACAGLLLHRARARLFLSQAHPSRSRSASAAARALPAPLLRPAACPRHRVTIARLTRPTGSLPRRGAGARPAGRPHRPGPAPRPRHPSRQAPAASAPPRRGARPRPAAPARGARRRSSPAPASPRQHMRGPYAPSKSLYALLWDCMLDPANAAAPNAIHGWAALYPILTLP